MNTRAARRVIVIGVNAKTEKTKTWDERSGGPGTASVLNAATGIPMSSFSDETLGVLREYAIEQMNFFKITADLNVFEVAFENIPDEASLQPPSAERQFFLNLPTTFELSRHEVDCLKERGASLLREATAIELQRRPFHQFVADALHARIEGPALPRPNGCNTQQGPKLVGVRSHYLDIGAEWSLSKSNSDDVGDRQGPGFLVRLVRPNGFGVLSGYSPESFPIRLPVGAVRVDAGDLLLRAISGGLAYSWHRGRFEASPSVTAGYGFGGFDPSTEARDAYARIGIFGLKGDATNSWLVTPAFRLSFNLTNRLAAIGSVGYSYARPTLRVEGETGLIEERRVRAAATKFSIGLGVSPF